MKDLFRYFKQGASACSGLISVVAFICAFAWFCNLAAAITLLNVAGFAVTLTIALIAFGHSMDH